MEYAIEFKNVSKTFRNTDIPAVNNVSLSIEAGNFVVILGTSGSGKTTLLKMVNGVVDKTAGDIYIHGKNTSTLNMIEARRQIGYVIQQVGLFPHMTIYDNIATVPKALRWEKHRIEERIEELLHLVKLSPDQYKHRLPKELSGGQQQRIGIARALAANPDLLLMDEPFASLDALTKSELQDEILKIHKTYKKTILFVSHDIGEAIKLADKIIVMDKGKVLQYDTPYQIVNHPANPFIRELVQAFESFTKPYASISSLCEEK